MPIPKGQPAHRYVALGRLPETDYGTRGFGWVCFHCGEEKHVWRDVGRWWVGYGPDEEPHPSPCHPKRCGCHITAVGDEVRAARLRQEEGR